jgi:hypothetical protein
LIAALAARGVTAQGRTGINVWVPVADEASVVTRLRLDGYAVAPGSLFRQSADPGVRVTVAPLHSRDIGRLADSIARAVTGTAGAAPSA